MGSVGTSHHDAEATSPTTPLNIVILSYGTRGDIQPYIRITQELQSHGHRVRLTVPPSLESWVRDDYGIETWSSRHDMGKFTRWGLNKPSKKMLSMVNGEFQSLKTQMLEWFVEHWRASVDEGGPKKSGERPFVADVILASPPGMTHVHIAQRLGIPLMLTHFNPKTITRHWPHGDKYPSDNVFKPCDENREGWISGDNRIWKRYFRGIINKARKRHLDMQPLSKDFWPLKFWELGIPVNYLISPQVLPQPDDFPSNHQFVGFTHLDQLRGFTPDPTLVEFLAGPAGPGPTIYVDFGSNEWIDRRGLTSTVLKAAKAANVRAVFRKSWFVADSVPEGVFITEELPHSWLFPRIDLVLQSAGAGATAISLKSGVPSAIVPFRGDQYLWCKAIERLGAAPPAVNINELTEAKLTALVKEALDPKYKTAAKKVAETIKNEPDGATAVAKNLHEHLSKINGYPPRCSLLPDRQAVWTVRGKPEIRISALAAHFLDARKTIAYEKLDLLKVVDWDKFESLRPWETKRDRPNDVVRKTRVAQGVFDANGNEGVAEEVLARWTAVGGTTPQVNGK